MMHGCYGAYKIQDKVYVIFHVIIFLKIEWFVILYGPHRNSYRTLVERSRWRSCFFPILSSSCFLCSLPSSWLLTIISLLQQFCSFSIREAPLEMLLDNNVWEVRSLCWIGVFSRIFSFGGRLLLSSPFSTEFPSLQSDPICEHLKHLIDTLVIIDRALFFYCICRMSYPSAQELT